jgi:hypothetical protein
MSGVGLVGIAAEGNENTFLNDSEHTMFQLRNEDHTIDHFSMYHGAKDASGPITVSNENETEYVIKLPMEDDGIGAGFAEFTLPEIASTRQEGISWNKNLLSAFIKRV